MLDTQTQQLYIHGRYVASSTGKTFSCIHPASGEEICKVFEAGQKELQEAIQSAQEGFKVWSKYTGAERAKVLRRAADLLRERNDELARLEVWDTGKPLSEAIEVDIMSGADALDYFAGVAPTLHGDHYDLSGAFAYTRREPLGVCAGIGAWNYPIQIACWKSAPALACGNAMIFKPSELTPLTALKLAEIYTEAGLPEGVFNVLQGGEELGKLLTIDPAIKKVSLTGEVETGKKVMAAAASTLKHVTLELGGKSPLIVFEDADLENAVSASMVANFYTQGEICSNGTRVFVHKNILDQFLSKLIPRVEAICVAQPFDQSCTLGSLISKEHQKRVLDYIALGVREGARLVCGGTVPNDPDLNAGAYVMPTVFTDCRDDMTIVKEEIFGPVMTVLAFDDEDEVITRANATDYGLAGAVFTKDLSRGHRVVAQLEAGTCWINNYNITPIEMPFGGYKQSGIGRENSLAAVEHYTQIKSVYVELGNVESPF